MNNLKSSLLIGVVCSTLTLGTYKMLGFDKKEVVINEASPSGYTRFTSESDTKPLAGPGALPVDFTYAAEKTTPAVVHIQSTVLSNRQAQDFQRMPDLFRDFFGEEGNPHVRPEGPHKAQSSGSGVIINPDGYIITNNHVVEDADEVEVILYDKRTLKAKVIGTDPSTDLAVIQIDAKNLPSLVLGNSDQVKVGEWVLAVGNPFNLESTVTAGIVSAKGRNINILRREDNTQIESFIQTDAAVNPGNSGGALVNLQGELIGINTAIATPTGTYAGYSFAVPSGIVRKVSEDLIKYGVVQRGFLGVSIRNLDGKLAKELELNIYEGIYVEGVEETGSAKAAGIKKGDVIVKVDGNSVRSSSELQETIARHKPGETVSVTINREGKEREIKVQLRNRAGNNQLVKREEGKITPELLGAKLEDLTEKEKKNLGIESGVKISKLSDGKLKDNTDIREGFIITRIDKQPIKSAKEALDILQNVKEGVMLEGVYPGYPKKYYYAFGF